MFRSRLTVTVPQPCHEDWSVMTPQAQGRFCQSCQKTVVDFTQMSNTQVAQWLSKQQGSTCGRFRTDQLGKELLTASSIRQRWTWRAAVLTFIAWLSTKSTEAQTTSSDSKLEQTAQSTNTKPTVSTLKKSLNTDSLVIKGTVLDSATNSPIPGATVVLKHTQIGVTTNSKGDFTLKIPSDLLIEQQKILVAFVELAPQELSLRDLITRNNVVINLAPDHNALAGEVVVVNSSSKWYTPRGFCYKIKSLFR